MNWHWYMDRCVTLKYINSRIGVSSTVALVVAFIIGIAIVYFALGQLFGKGTGIIDWIWNWFAGGGWVAVDISDEELGQALLCAHWRCIGGCDEVESMSSTWTKLTYLGKPGCPCDDSWDTNNDGRICGAESKTHPIKVQTTEDRVVSRGWYADYACDGGCNSVFLTKRANCEHADLNAGENLITFNKDSSPEIECIKKGGKNDYCIVPKGTWYLWAFDNTLVFSQTHHSDAIVCDNKPSGIPSCNVECTARGYISGQCASSPPSTPTCAGGLCTYWENIGDLYCTSNDCYCQGREMCNCARNKICTEHGCELITEQSFVCCQNLREGWTDWLIAEGVPPTQCPVGTKVSAINCNPTAPSDYIACQSYCYSRDYGEFDYDFSTSVCKCSEPGCVSLSDRASCVAAANCQWCDKCVNGVGPQTLSIVANWDRCIPDSQSCGYYDCIRGQCGATCDNGDCPGETCNKLTCQCETAYCCHDPYNPLNFICTARSLCGGIIGDICNPTNPNCQPP